MKQCEFKQVVVIGCGKIAVTAIKYVASLKEKLGFDLCFIQHEMQELTAVKKYCDEESIPFFSLPQKEDVTSELLKYEENTLIISAGNYYLFPKKLLSKTNITAINFHNALLPKYPGRNAPSWAIFYGEKESGATWHRITECVDEGEILWQGACEITEDMKAYELTAKIMELAQQGLEEILEEFLTQSILGKKQESIENRRMFYAKDVPGNGIVSVKDEPQYIYGVLRSMDYGKMGPFDPVIMKLENGQEVEVLRYKKKALQNEDVAENSCIIPLDGENGLFIKFKIKE